MKNHEAEQLVPRSHLLYFHGKVSGCSQMYLHVNQGDSLVSSSALWGAMVGSWNKRRLLDFWLRFNLVGLSFSVKPRPADCGSWVLVHLLALWGPSPG